MKTLARFAFVALGTLMAAGMAAPAGPETTAAALRDRIVAGSRAAEWVSQITDLAGPRLPGSPGDRAGVAVALDIL